MMHSRCVSLSLSVALSLSPLRAQTRQDSASITAFYERWMGSASQGFTAYASFYAPDGYILPQGSPPSVGRTAIAEWFERASAASPYTVRPQGVVVDDMRFLSPNWVVHRSTLRGQRVARTGGDSVPFETKYVDLLHRTRTNNWEVVFRMWSDNR